MTRSRVPRCVRNSASTKNDKLVIGVGYADLRKGFDLFLQLCRLLRTSVINTGKRRDRVCLVWIGGIDPGLKDWLATEIADAEATGTFRMAGYRDDMDAVFSAADAFALTSREDPFPTVVLEALALGCPWSRLTAPAASRICCARRSRATSCPMAT